MLQLCQKHQSPPPSLDQVCRMRFAGLAGPRLSGPTDLGTATAGVTTSKSSRLSSALLLDCLCHHMRWPLSLPCAPRAGLPSWGGCVCFWGHVIFACCSMRGIPLFSPACLRDRATWQGCAPLFPHCFPTSCQSFCLCFRSHQVVLDWWLMQKYFPPSLPTPSFVQGPARTIVPICFSYLRMSP